METLAVFTVVTMHNKESHDTARYVCTKEETEIFEVLEEKKYHCNIRLETAETSEQK